MDLNKNSGPKTGLIKRASKIDKRTDIITAELQKGFEWTQKYSRFLGAGVAVILIGGAAWAITNSLKTREDKNLQSEYSQLDFAVTKQKEIFERGKNPPPPPVKGEDGKTPEPLPSAVATGDLAKDYGKVVTDLESFLTKHPDAPAGAMASLRLAGLYSEYNNPEESLKALQTVKYDKGLLGSLVKMELGSQLANTGKCPEAEQVWGKLFSNSSDAFLKSEIRLKQGLCAESRGELAQAEQNYREAMELGSESETSKSAAKYLRLLKFKGPSDVKTQ